MAAENVDDTTMTEEPTTTHTAETEIEETGGTGLDENVAGALAYLFGFITGAIFFLIDDRQSVRFHGAQSMLLAVGIFVGAIALTVIGTFLSILLGDVFLVGLLIWLGMTLVWLVVGLGGFALWVYMMYTAYKGKNVTLPIIGGIAENLAEKN